MDSHSKIRNKKRPFCADLWGDSKINSSLRKNSSVQLYQTNIFIHQIFALVEGLRPTKVHWVYRSPRRDNICSSFVVACY